MVVVCGQSFWKKIVYLPMCSLVFFPSQENKVTNIRLISSQHPNEHKSSAKFLVHLLSVPSVREGVIPPSGADGLSAVGALSPPDRLPAVADTVLVTLGAGVPPRDVAPERGCNFERVVWGETFSHDVK